jgi:hypothetical protein
VRFRLWAVRRKRDCIRHDCDQRGLAGVADGAVDPAPRALGTMRKRLGDEELIAQMLVRGKREADHAVSDVRGVCSTRKCSCAALVCRRPWEDTSRYAGGGTAGPETAGDAASNHASGSPSARPMRVQQAV